MLLAVKGSRALIAFKTDSALCLLTYRVFCGYQGRFCFLAVLSLCVTAYKESLFLKSG